MQWFCRRIGIPYPLGRNKFFQAMEDRKFDKRKIGKTNSLVGLRIQASKVPYNFDD